MLLNEDKMNPIKKEIYTVEQLVNYIYDENLGHFEFEENMGGEPCDCHLHLTMETIMKYWEA